MPQCKQCIRKAQFKLYNYNTRTFDFFCDLDSNKWRKNRQYLTKEDEEAFEKYIQRVK